MARRLIAIRKGGERPPRPEVPGQVMRHGTGSRHAGVGIIAFAAVVVITLWTGISYNAWQNREAAIEQAEIGLNNLARAHEENIDSILDTVDRAAHLFRQQYLRRSGTNEPDAIRRDGQFHNPIFLQLAIAGPDGTIVRTANGGTQQRTSIADREHFQVHLHGHDDTLFVGRPFVSPAMDRTVVPISLRIDL